MLAAAATEASAPRITGADVGRYQQLERHLREELGDAQTGRIATLADSLTRAQILEEGLQAASSLLSPAARPDGRPASHAPSPIRA